MASLPELARFRTSLSADEVAHLQRLVANWGPLADLCFADLLLWAPTADERERFIVLAHMRPITSQTIYRVDWTGEVATRADRPVVAETLAGGGQHHGEIDHGGIDERVSVLAIPVARGSSIPAVVTREVAPSMTRRQGELEQTYMDIFDRFALMIGEGSFPYEREDRRIEFVPRVGDGVILLDVEGRVEFTSPNAVSALVRLGVNGQAAGLRLHELGVDESVVRQALTTRMPVTEEIDIGMDTTVVLRAQPLLVQGKVTGGVVMLRDISELRRRDRLLMSKDATIREIHHRVKNNLQTISSLLRLQGRRLTSPEAKAAVEESVRRIRSIALVHETLSRDAGEDVPFIEIVRPLVRMVEEGYTSPDRPLHFKVSGDAGKLPATMATPLAVVLTELLQNVVDHAYPVGDDVMPGQAVVELDNDGRRLRVEVRDDGVGLPEGFSFDATTGLGLQIVRTLVETELTGEIELRAGDGPEAQPGTVVEVCVALQTEPDGEAGAEVVEGSP